MAGIKLGDRLLVVGCSDPILLAQLAVKTGLTGRAFAVDEREAVVTAAADIATREGALVETATRAVDLAARRERLVRRRRRPRRPAASAAHRRAACIAEVARALRPGGRCLVIDGTVRKGFSALVAADRIPATTLTQGGPVQVFTAQGFKAARILAEREGLVFAEAVKPALIVMRCAALARRQVHYLAHVR